jgi:hypothetical protein
MDLRDFGHGELSLVVYNDEYLYNNRFRLTESELKELGFKFTSDQWVEFQNDLEGEE